MNAKSNPLSTQALLENSKDIATFSLPINSEDVLNAVSRLEDLSLSKYSRKHQHHQQGKKLILVDAPDSGPSNQQEVDKVCNIMCYIEYASFCRDVLHCGKNNCKKGMEYLCHLRQHIESYKVQDIEQFAACERCPKVIEAIINHANGLCHRESDQIEICKVPFCDILNKDCNAHLRDVTSVNNILVQLSEMCRTNSLYKHSPDVLQIEDSRDESMIGCVYHAGKDYICRSTGQFGVEIKRVNISFKDCVERLRDPDSSDGTQKKYPIELITVDNSRSNLAVHKALLHSSEYRHINSGLWVASTNVTTTQSASNAAQIASAARPLYKYLAVPRVEGHTLREYRRLIAENPASGDIKWCQSEYLSILQQILLAGEYLHHKHIVYSLWTVDDVKVIHSKPPHILLNDFSLAVMSSSSQSPPAASSVSGRDDSSDVSDDEDDDDIPRAQIIPPAYLPPELFSTDYYPSTSSDVWSIGCLAFELVKAQCVYPQFTHAHSHCIIELICNKSRDMCEEDRTSSDMRQEQQLASSQVNEAQFMTDLAAYWTRKGFTLRIPQTFADEDFNLYKLRESVSACGGSESCSWREVSTAVRGAPQYSRICYYHYINIIKPYMDNVEQPLEPNRPLRPVRPKPDKMFSDLFSGFLDRCWQIEPSERYTCSQLLNHVLFTIYHT